MTIDAPAAETPAATSGADFGLTADEQAAYDSMKTSAPATGEPGYVEPEAPADPAPAPAPANGAAAPAAGAEPAPLAAAAAAAAAAEPDDDDDDPAPLADGKPPKRVSYNKYRRLEEAVKAEKDALAAEREKNVKAAENQARLDERLRLINEALTPAAAAAPQDEDPEPDPEVDIFGHNAWLKRQLVKTTQSVTERLNQIDADRQAGSADQQLASTYMDDAQRFSATEPNFVPAYSYLMQVRTAQLANYHYGKDLTDPNTPALTAQEVAKIKSEVAREEKTLVGQAIKAGKSPAAAVYAMARMTGYRPQAAAASAGAAPAANGSAAPAANGAAPVAAAVAAAAPAAANGAAKPTVRAEIDKIKSGQEAALSLSHGGGAPAPVLNAEKLANMPEEEFGALLDQMSRGELKRIMGGGA